MYIKVTRYAELKERRMVSHNASEGFSPEICLIALGQGFLHPEARNVVRDLASVSASCRGRRPWRVIQRFTVELGRAMLFSNEASNKLKRQGGGVAVWQSDRPILEE